MRDREAEFDLTVTSSNGNCQIKSRLLCLSLTAELPNSALDRSFPSTSGADAIQPLQHFKLVWMFGLSETIRSGQSGKFPQSTLLALEIVETACKNDLTGSDVNCIFIFEGQGVIDVARDESGDVVLAGLEVGHDKVIGVVHDEMLFTVRHIAAAEIHSAPGLHHDAVQVELVALGILDFVIGKLYPPNDHGGIGAGSFRQLPLLCDNRRSRASGKRQKDQQPNCLNRLDVTQLHKSSCSSAVTPRKEPGLYEGVRLVRSCLALPHSC